MAAVATLARVGRADHGRAMALEWYDGSRLGNAVARETWPTAGGPPETIHPIEGRSFMSQTREPSVTGPGWGAAGLRVLVNRLAGLWSSPRVGRVALCSPVVGLIAGLG